MTAKERLVPARHLHLGLERAERVHDLAARGEVRVRVDREEDRVRVALVRGPSGIALRIPNTRAS